MRVQDPFSCRSTIRTKKHRCSSIHESEGDVETLQNRALCLHALRQVFFFVCVCVSTQRLVPCAQGCLARVPLHSSAHTVTYLPNIDGGLGISKRFDSEAEQYGLLLSRPVQAQGAGLTSCWLNAKACFSASNFHGKLSILASRAEAWQAMQGFVGNPASMEGADSSRCPELSAQ